MTANSGSSGYDASVAGCKSLVCLSDVMAIRELKPH